MGFISQLITGGPHLVWSLWGLGPVMFKGLTLHDLTFDRFPSREIRLTAEQKGDAAWCKTHNWWINFTSRIQAIRVINTLSNIFSNDRTTMACHLALSKTQLPRQSVDLNIIFSTNILRVSPQYQTNQNTMMLYDYIYIQILIAKLCMYRKISR